MHIFIRAYVNKIALIIKLNFQRILKGEHHLTKSQYMQASTDTSITATSAATSVTTSIAITC